jgi:hypothetical protein
MGEKMKKVCPYCCIEFMSDNKRKICCSSVHATRLWEKNNPERKKANVEAYTKSHVDQRKAIKLKHYYKMTLEQYNTMKLEQNGVCKVCFSACKTGRDLAVDHDHRTGKIRGLLCSNCNTVLGAANDNVDILLNAIRYLENAR